MEDAGTKPCPFLRLYIPQHLLERQSAEQAHLTAFGSSKQCSSEPVVTKLHFTDVGCTPVQLRLKRHQPWHVLWRSFNGVNTTGPTQAQKAATAPRLVLEEDPANNECLALPIAVELPYGAAFPPPSIQVCVYSGSPGWTAPPISQQGVSSAWHEVSDFLKDHLQAWNSACGMPARQTVQDLQRQSMASRLPTGVPGCGMIWSMQQVSHAARCLCNMLASFSFYTSRMETAVHGGAPSSPTIQSSSPTSSTLQSSSSSAAAAAAALTRISSCPPAWPLQASIPPSAAAALVLLSYLLQWLLGIALGCWLLQNRVLSAAVIEAGCTWALSWLDGQIAWLMGAQPAGVKLHLELCTLMGTAAQRLLHAYAAVLRAVAGACGGAHVLAWLCAAACVSLGAVGGLAVLEDGLVLITAPTAILYCAMCWLYRKHLSWLTSTWSMMRGQYKRGTRLKQASPGNTAPACSVPTCSKETQSVEGKGQHAANGRRHTGRSAASIKPPLPAHKAQHPVQQASGPTNSSSGSGMCTRSKAHRELAMCGDSSLQGTSRSRGGQKQYDVSAAQLEQVPHQPGVHTAGTYTPNANVPRKNGGSAYARDPACNGGDVRASAAGSWPPLLTLRLVRSASSSVVGAGAAAAAAAVPLSRLEALLGLPVDPQSKEVVVEQLIVGALLFVPLLVLLPSTLAFYLLALLVHGACGTARAGLRCLARGLAANLGAVLMLRLLLPSRFPGALTCRLLMQRKYEPSSPKPEQHMRQTTTAQQGSSDLHTVQRLPVGECYLLAFAPQPWHVVVLQWLRAVLHMHAWGLNSIRLVVAGALSGQHVLWSWSW